MKARRDCRARERSKTCPRFTFLANHDRPDRCHLDLHSFMLEGCRVPLTSHYHDGRLCAMTIATRLETFRVLERAQERWRAPR